MKVTTYCRIDIATGETLEEESYEYSGPVALCVGNASATGEGYSGSGLSGNGESSGGSDGHYGGVTHGQTNVGFSFDDGVAEAKKAGFWDNVKAAVATALAAAKFGLIGGATVGYKSYKDVQAKKAAMIDRIALANPGWSRATIEAAVNEGLFGSTTDPEVSTTGEGSERGGYIFNGESYEYTESGEGITATAESDSAIWDQFIDAWFGLPSYEQEAAQSNFQNYFATAKPGDTQEWAGGTLTMGADGVATYQPANGEAVQFTANTSMEELYNNNPGIAQAWDAAYPTSTAMDAVQGHADYLGQAAGTYQNTIQGANDKQNGLLDSLIADSQAGTGLYKPINFSIGNANLGFVPGQNLKQAAQQAEFGHQGFTNTNQTAGNILNTSAATSPYAGLLAQLTAMQQASKLEQARREAEQEAAYRLKALEQGLTISNNQLKANEPGWLTQLAGLNNILGDNGFLSEFNPFNSDNGWSS